MAKKDLMPHEVLQRLAVALASLRLGGSAHISASCQTEQAAAAALPGLTPPGREET